MILALVIVNVKKDAMLPMVLPIRQSILTIVTVPHLYRAAEDVDLPPLLMH
jgi:hypothetical protein